METLISIKPLQQTGHANEVSSSFSALPRVSRLLSWVVSPLETRMKLEYLADGSPDCPLLRLYDFSAAEAVHLRAALIGLASGTAERVEVHQLPFIESVGGCRLSLVRKSWDQAVLKVGPSAFECAFTAGTWDNIAGLVEPFTESAGGFQWLTGIPAEAALLLSASASGQW
jgi:hypothetical protein